MCTRLKVGKAYITQGMILQYKVLSGVKSGKFGMRNGSYTNVNARRESLGNIWREYFLNNRAVLEAESFMERGISFGKKDKPTKIACICDNDGNLAIITTDSIPEVAKVHHRMPCVIEDVDAWLQTGIIKFADSDIQQVAI